MEKETGLTCHIRPQVAMATAQVLFQRFFYMASLKEFGIVVIKQSRAHKHTCVS